MTVSELSPQASPPLNAGDAPATPPPQPALWRRIWRKVWRVLRWMLLAVLVLVVLVLGCWTVLPDEEQNPELQALLALQPEAHPEQNAFYALWGLDAAPERDAYQVGWQVVQAYEALLKSGGKPETFDPKPIIGSTAGAVPHAEINTCAAHEAPPCLDGIRAHRSELEALAKAQAPYLQRYRDLRQYDHFENTMTRAVSEPFMSWQHVGELSSLVDAQIVYGVEKPQTRAAALAELQQEVALWRRLGRDSNSLVAHFVAAAQLMHKLRLTSLLLSQSPAWASQYPAEFQALTQALDPADVSMDKALKMEVRFSAAIHQNMLNLTEEPWLLRRLASLQFRPNATLNTDLALRQRVLAVYAKRPIIDAAASAEAVPSVPLPNLASPSLWLYNPIGKVLNSIAGSQVYVDYFRRMIDLQAYSRLVELQRQIAVAHLPPDQVAAFVAGVGPDLRDPYTGQAMQYDAQAHTLSFHARGGSRTEGREYVVRLAL